MKRLLVIAALAVGLALPFVVTNAASAHGRSPVIGCDQLGGSIPGNHYLWRHAPTGYCQTGAFGSTGNSGLGTLTGIDNAHWKYWGGHVAIASGQFVDGLGFRYSARIVAYDHVVTHHAFGDLYLNYYAKLHVMARGGYRGSVFHGPFNVTLNSSPGT